MKKGKKLKFFLWITFLSLFLFLCILVYSWLFSTMLRARITVEAGDIALSESDFLRPLPLRFNYKILTDLSTIDTRVPGEYPIQFLVNGNTQISILRIVDTVAPTATITPVTIPTKIKPSAKAFVSSIKDKTAVKVSFEKALKDPLSAGTYEVSIKLTDAGGNQTLYSSQLTVVDVVPSVTVELGIKNLSPDLFRIHPEDTILFPDDIDLFLKDTGTHEIVITVNETNVPVELIVKDTTPPKAKVKNLSIWLGETPEPNDFIEELIDASFVTVSYHKVPDFNQLGSQKVSLLLTDMSGNETKLTTTLTVRKDKEPPQILGAKDFSVPLGTTIYYRKNVFVEDNRDKEVSLFVDSSQVNPKKLGTYPVTYTATDSSGNQASVTVSVTMIKELPIKEKTVYQLADQILSEITDDSMTNREKARAIFDWCQTEISYSGTSDKSNVLLGAYKGFKKRKGDCYTYYSTAEILLLRSGIDSICVARKGGSIEHYWNLVNCGDGWYHFDACPLLKGETFVPFLVTDEELLSFSRDYGKRHPDPSHTGYYEFDKNAYPERGKGG